MVLVARKHVIVIMSIVNLSRFKKQQLIHPTVLLRWTLEDCLDNHPQTSKSLQLVTSLVTTP